MEVKILGCSNSWTPRWTSCYLVNNDILMDCGYDAYKAYIRTGKPLADIKLFLITHFHADHIYGLNVFLTRLQKGYDNLSFKPMIVGPKGIKEMCERVFFTCNLFEYDFSQLIDFVEVEDGYNFEFEGIKITAYKLDHGDVVDFGYILSQNGKSIGYTGDTTICDALHSFIEKCDICLIDTSRMASNEKHMGYNSFVELLKKYPNKTLYATHCDTDVYNAPLLKGKRAEEGMIIKV